MNPEDNLACNAGNDNGEKMKINVSFARSPNFVKEYATKTVVQPTEYDIRISFLNEKIKENNYNEIMIIDSMMILTPIAAKELKQQLDEIISEWEKKNPISPRPEKTIYAKISVE